MSAFVVDFVFNFGKFSSPRSEFELRLPRFVPKPSLYYNDYIGVLTAMTPIGESDYNYLGDAIILVVMWITFASDFFFYGFIIGSICNP